jgi:hypothetical protein
MRVSLLGFSAGGPSMVTEVATERAPTDVRQKQYEFAPIARLTVCLVGANQRPLRKLAHCRVPAYHLIGTPNRSSPR